MFIGKLKFSLEFYRFCTDPELHSFHCHLVPHSVSTKTKMSLPPIDDLHRPSLRVPVILLTVQLLDLTHLDPSDRLSRSVPIKLVIPYGPKTTLGWAPRSMGLVVRPYGLYGAPIGWLISFVYWVSPYGPKGTPLRKLRFQKNPCLNLNSLLKRGYFRISCLIAEINEEASEKVLENFDPNPYFEDANLTKTFTFLDEGTKISASKIKWKEGMGLPNGVDHEKKGNKIQFAEERQKDDMDEIHDEVAEIIKEDLWPNPLTYFNNDDDEEDFEDDEEVDKQGLPIGLQLIGHPWGEATVLRLASAIEELCIKSRKTPASFYDISKAK
ncbi:NAP1-related protein 2 [Hibiscus syriacus]|uniref:NAP1-related protein 2 n=1 Tax=Hibiscus syriacus TaxID=106335 RepID=A0A6A3B6H5_HIBSY|nr:NAP1-related protein 2 [Hibiscus syriacus]